MRRAVLGPVCDMSPKTQGKMRSTAPLAGDMGDEFQEQADLARSLDARVARVHAHIGEDFSTALVIERLDAYAAAMSRIKEAIQALCRKRGRSLLRARSDTHGHAETDVGPVLGGSNRVATSRSQSVCRIGP